MRELEHSRPADIEAESFRIIGAELEERGIVLPADQAPLVKRAIHTTADFDYARNLVFTPGAVEAGVRALRAGTPILTDTNMARSGINRGALERLGISVHCFMADPEVVGRGLARRLTSRRFVLCHSLLQRVQTQACYLFPVRMGRLLTRMTARCNPRA